MKVAALACTGDAKQIEGGEKKAAIQRCQEHARQRNVMTKQPHRAPRNDVSRFLRLRAGPALPIAGAVRANGQSSHDAYSVTSSSPSLFHVANNAKSLGVFRANRALPCLSHAAPSIGLYWTQFWCRNVNSMAQTFVHSFGCESKRLGACVAQPIAKTSHEKKP